MKHLLPLLFICIILITECILTSPSFLLDIIHPCHSVTWQSLNVDLSFEVPNSMLVDEFFKCSQFEDL